MSPLVTELVRQYRARANEARALANATGDEGNREKWLQVADTWERMAAFEERNNAKNTRRAKANQPA